VFFVMTDEWENHSIEFVMPEGAVTITAVIVASRWDGVACDFAFDDMFLMNSGILDVVPPVAVTNVGATIDDYANLVTWVDVDGEEGETYNVYTSTVPIEDVTSSSVDVVKKKALEGSPAAVHYLHNPLVDTEVTSYYAVTCVDASNNVGAPGVSGSVTNTARGVPTISMTPPAAFAADGDLSEWYDSGIAPFEIGAADNSYGTPHIGFGVVDDDDDLYGTFFAAVDNDYFYLAAEITDNDVNTEGTGGWWTTDVVQLCIGLYDQRGAKHVGQQRGAEPDYKMYFTPAGANSDNGAGVLAAHGDGNYFHSVFNPDYAFEFRISLDSLVIEDDARLIPVNGMRTPFELMIHDNDGGTWEGQLTLSNTNDDNAHQTCEVWSNTWIGDQSTILETDQDLVAHEFALFPNYPNPFNPVTTIRFSLPEKQHVTLQIYNLIGQEVATVINKELPAGFHNLIWNAENIPSGVYLYRLASKEKAISNKMILLK
ncbi:MAG: T9SS type A sorting domain-containing protein, partial [Candidatus Marinimicrobia bacterium]|nr:T9SS type A sorting domain-containing protein [Candidatus Neomarinimicrobiota bacterium]